MSPKFPKSHLYRLQPQLSPLPGFTPKDGENARTLTSAFPLLPLASSVLGPF